MSYENLVINAVAVTEEMVPGLPAKTRSSIVKIKVDFIVEEKELLFFVDVAYIRSLNRTGNRSLCIPITTSLLNRYGVTPQRFIEDFNNRGIVFATND